MTMRHSRRPAADSRQRGLTLVEVMVAMTIGIMPITGLPLPWISYGGSGVVTFFALIGLVQNVHMRRYR